METPRQKCNEITGEGIMIFLPSSINLITIDALTLFALEN